ncbi:MAG TPA: hypothetical protein VMW04_02065 [Patescibacteria group bacterium]|nr:hypothetical protein [Patescibacteria group bacterium]
MATLTETAYYSRQAIKYGSIAVVILLILRGAFLSFRTYWKKAHPPPPPAPTVTFGKLPKLEFPERKDLPKLSFKLETISGTLPKLATQAKVFFIPQPSSNLLAWDNTKAWARQLGFNREPEAIDRYEYRFTSETNPPTILEVHVLSKNFRLYYDWKSDLEILSQGNPPQEKEAIALARGFLQGAGALSEDLSQGPAEVTYLKYKDGNLTKALFFSEANFAKVNLFRQDLDNLKILPANPKDTNVSITIGPTGNRNRGIIEAKYTYASISQANFATYPLKDVNAAWSQLTDGKAFVANLGNNSGEKIIIRNAYLAYYDSENPQNFLQPVIVFEGDNDFYAYVPAVSETWFE